MVQGIKGFPLLTGAFKEFGVSKMQAFQGKYIGSKRTSKMLHGEGIGRLILACILSSIHLNATLYSEAVLRVLVLIKDDLFIKRMLTTWHPYTRVTFLCQMLQSDIGKRTLSLPPASLLPKYGRNRIRAGRRTRA